MRVIQTVFGAFHHFDLARELQRRHHLEAIYSTWHWGRLQREGLPRSQVKTFPWLHVPEIALQRSGVRSIRLFDELGYANALLFDEYTYFQRKRLPAPDALVALAGSSLKTGRMLQDRGTIFLCDRGSSHQRYQEEIVSFEYKLWGVDQPVSDIRDTLREEEIYAVADGITVPSHFAARSYVEHGIPAEKIHVIPYGVRLDHFQPSDLPPPIQDRFELLFAGQVSLRKGVPYLLEAFAALQHPNKRLRIVGSIAHSFREVLPRLPQQHVEFLSEMPQAELARVMSSSHLLVLPSIEEGLALVQGQAMACGCPVLASRNTGGEDLFTDEQEGFIVPIRDIGALTDRMQRMVDEPGLYEQLRECSLKRVSSIGGWTEYGDAWEALLKHLTAGRTPA
jgi:starch synthase